MEYETKEKTEKEIEKYIDPTLAIVKWTSPDFICTVLFAYL